MRVIGADHRPTLLAAASDLGQVSLGRDLVAAERVGGDVFDRDSFEDGLIGADKQPTTFTRML
jgi:hypothetical protein